MASKLEVYRETLLILGQERIASLSESSTARFAIDDHYDRAVTYCLEQGFWNFAMRSVLIDSAPAIEPEFGYTFAFEKPSDWVRTHSFSADERFTVPLLELNDEAGVWYADVDPLYLRYVSNDADYGMDLSRWPESFFNYVATRLALRTCKRITGSDASDTLQRAEKKALANARSKDAMNEPPALPPTGSWASSRRGGFTNRSRWDRRS